MLSSSRRLRRSGCTCRGCRPTCSANSALYRCTIAPSASVPRRPHQRPEAVPRRCARHTSLDRPRRPPAKGPGIGSPRRRCRRHARLHPPGGIWVLPGPRTHITRPRVARVIKDLTGVRYEQSGVWRLLRRRG
ncbi:winged helix-turn-helix domain-containing protein [Dactylosporangium sp. NPDC050588]|uniref:winged helix-turn-helix domain-containing protein n=1 Tax=Dactylosporangium sp. NPDC050588 TaxID=3157211 RepID=UPI0033EE33E1